MQEEEIKLSDRCRDIVVVIVEGPSDKMYLETPMSLIFERNYGSDSRFLVISDITGDYLYEKADVGHALDTFIEGELRKPKFKMSEEIAKHIIAIHHIIDIDETYITSDLVTKGDYDEFHYSIHGISYKDPDEIIRRNKVKSENIEKLLIKKSVGIFKLQIPYHLYYYSVNIDHFYFNQLNLTDTEKAQYARVYFQSILDKKSDSGRIKKFYTDINRINPPNYPTDYNASWDYIKKHNNCLKRCTNVFLIK